MKGILIFSFLFLFSNVGYGGENPKYGDPEYFNNVLETPDAETPDAETPDAAAADATDALAIAATVSAGLSAGASGKGSKVLGGLSMLLGGALIRKGMKSKPTDYVTIIMGVMTLAQGANAMKANKQNKGVQRSLCKGCEGGSGGGDGLASVDAVDERGYSTETRELIETARGAGVRIDGDKVVSPDGTVSVAQAGSMDGLASAFGLSGNQLDTLKKDVAKMNAKLLKKYGGKKMAVAGGKGSSSGSRVIYEEEDEEDGFLSGKNNNKKRYTASVSGLAKKFGDSMIGVKGDNIFQIIHRSYQSKKTLLLQK